jgi:Family of unknown function (DUF5677)
MSGIASEQNLDENDSSDEMMPAELSNLVLQGLREKWQVSKGDESLPGAGMGKAIEARWGAQMSDLGLLIEHCQNIGSKFHRSYLKEKSGLYRARSEVLTKLHIRGCRIAEEVLLLMTQGFAEGALARWRSLFEITVIATLISEADESLAERWLAHEAIDQKKAMDKQHESATVLGLEPAEFPETTRISREYNSAIKRYGDNFESDYGWAAGQLGFGNRPTFRDLQSGAKQQAMAYYIKIANLAAHGSAMTSTDLFHRGDTDPLIPGYRGEQLELVGANMAQTLAQLSSFLIPEPWDFDDIVEIQIMLRLRNDIVAGLYQTSDQIEADNQSYLAAAVQKSEREQRYRYRKNKPKN